MIAAFLFQMPCSGAAITVGAASIAMENFQIVRGGERIQPSSLMGELLFVPVNPLFLELLIEVSFRKFQKEQLG